ncbi:hypothetical protein [Limosilactobacillus reuteri]|uniref:hypothetical protein n=1 Tax=Limosilactobacillus reuteri TaxID=1598 RepID=UPI001E3922A6|nr:hypothetical protein [Limosilactobacillus reuteri]MCC4503177.1 hypothetical protein [Limosilactobacillus reuteri]
MKIYFTQNSIKHQTQKAMLIKMPHSMKEFWMPLSLIYPTAGKYYVCYIPDNFKVSSAKSHEEIGHADIEEAFEDMAESLTNHRAH